MSGVAVPHHSNILLYIQLHSLAALGRKHLWWCVWLVSKLQTDMGKHLLSQLPREWDDSVAGQGCSSAGPYCVPVAPAGTRNDRNGQLQPRRPQGAWLLV